MADLLRLARAAPVRYALVFAALSAVAMVALLAVIYWWMSSLLESHLDDGIVQQIEMLHAVHDQDGRDAVLGLVRRHDEAPGENPYHFLVRDGEGRKLGGDLPANELGEGWHDISFRASSGTPADGDPLLRGRGEWLDDDLFVLVTNETGDLRRTRALMIEAFAVTTAATLLLALAGGLVINAVLLRRVEAVNRTARAIMAGDMSRRIPVVGPRDELGGLAESLNRMLSRIEELMANLQHVTSDIAHDLRTPLGRLRQRLERARDRASAGEAHEALLDEALAETDTLLRTFEAMLRIAQIEAGAPRARFARVDLSGVAGNVAEAFAAVAEDEGRELEARIEPDVAVHGDRELLTQMLANLVENALRHTPDGTPIALEVGPSGDGVRVVVADAGPGIPSGERARVFDRFYRLDASRSTAGSGLGLSLVGAVVNLHGGRIALEDAAPGLRVVIELERVAAA